MSNMKMELKNGIILSLGHSNFHYCKQGKTVKIAALYPVMNDFISAFPAMSNHRDDMVIMHVSPEELAKIIIELGEMEL